MERRLAAIVVADVVGYSRLVQSNEAETVASLHRRHGEIVAPLVSAHKGRVVKRMGDGVLLEFGSAVHAVECAIGVQDAMARLNESLPTGSRISLRMGINLGDVIVEGDDLYGDGVNIAARIEALADPGCIVVSDTVFSHVRGRAKVAFEDLGEHFLKNIDEPVRIYKAVRALQSGMSKAPPTIPRLAVAVLPFVNVSGDPEQEYFSDGITEDIITDLSKISALQVVSRNTAFSYKGRPTNVQEIAKRLRIGYVVEGSVRKSGGRIRITAQLIDAVRDAHVWAERYDRQFSDVFALQDEISEAIVSALKGRLLPEERRAIEQRSTYDADAYQLYLMGRHYFLLRGSRNYEIALRFCKRALDIDPNYARAWALAALCHSYLHLSGRSIDSGLTAAEKARRLDPGLAEAHAARGRVLAELGRFEEAIAAHEESLRLEPESFDIRHNFGMTCMEMGRHEETIVHLEHAARLLETDHTSLNLLALAHRGLGDETAAAAATRRALQRIEKELAHRPDNANLIAHGALALARLGERDRAREWIERAKIIEPDDATDQYNLGCALAQMNEPDKAFDLLEFCVPNMPPDFVVWLKQDSDLAPLHGDGRYAELVSRAERRRAEAQGNSERIDGPASSEIAYERVLD